MNEIVASNPASLAEPLSRLPDSESDSLSHVLSRRWRGMLTVTLLCGAVCCAAVWYLVQPKYEVSALLHMAPVVQPILFADADTDISGQYRGYVATEMSAMVSPAMLLTTLSSPEVESLPSVMRSANPLSDLSRQISVENLSGTHTLRVSMVGDDASDMAVIVNKLLDAYLRNREDKKRDWVRKILSSLRAEQTELEARLTSKSVELRQLAAENGTGRIDGSETELDQWMTELQQRLTQARQRLALTSAKLAALDEVGRLETLLELAPEGLADFGQDPEWQTTQTQLTSLETASLDDERLGRGPDHPEVRGRSKRIEMYREALSKRESELREQFKVSLRHHYEAERFDAEITVRVLEEAMNERLQQRTEVARHAFMLEDLRHERERLESALTQVRQKVWNVEVEQNRMARVTVDSPATPPPVPNIDKRLKYTIASCVFSLCLGIGFSLVRHRLDTSVREPGEVTRQLGMSLLGCVRKVEATNGTSLLRHEGVLEPMRGISTALLTSRRVGMTRSRLVTSPTAGSGKSTLALSLARSLAATGRRILLVDADNKGQGVTRASEMTDRPGLAEFLGHALKADAAVHPCETKHLSIMPAGQGADHFGDILSRQSAQEELRSLFEDFDEVIVDSPPILESSDAIVLATLIDEVVLVLRSGKSTRDEAAAARDLLATVGVKIVGVILNAVDPKTARYPYYGYAYTGGSDARNA